MSQKSKFYTDLKGNKCNGNHYSCCAVPNKFVNNINDPELNQELFTLYLQYINGTSTSYSSCTSNYNGKNQKTILSFLLNASAKFIFPTQYFGLIITHMTDTDLLKLVINQVSIDPEYIENLITQSINTNSYNNTSPLSILFSTSVKNQTLKYILSRIKIDSFVQNIPKFKNSLNSTNENLVVDFVKNNINEFLKRQELCLQMINTLPYKSSIFTELFKIIAPTAKDEVKIDLLNRAINNLDKNFILTIFEQAKHIIPDEKMIDSLLSRVYVNHGNRGASNNQVIADIMDVFILFGLKVTKNIIIKLLNKTCYINNIEKYSVPIDDDILYICSNFSYYPYKFDIKPPISVLIKECSKQDNLETIKKLKEYGGDYNTQCLIEACKNPKNGKVIKYLVQDCGVKTNETCVKSFQEAYKIEALDYVIAGYDPNKNNESKKTNQPINIDTESTLIIEPHNLNYNKNDNTLDFKLKAKIKKLFAYKKNTIKYLDIYEMMLKYLITKKLVIGNYFVINEELAGILKLESCSILHIDQLHNILTYLIDLA